MLNNLKATLNTKDKTKMQRADRTIKSCGLLSTLSKTALRGKPTTTTTEVAGRTTNSSIKSSSGRIIATTIQTLEVAKYRTIKDLKTIAGATMAATISLNKDPTIVAIIGRTTTAKTLMFNTARGAKRMTSESETTTIEISISKESLITSSTTAGETCGDPREAIGIHHHARISEMTYNNATITLTVDFRGRIMKEITTRNNLMAMTGISIHATTITSKTL